MAFRWPPAGDVNGDGYSDIIVGAYDFDDGQSDEGRAFVYHGSAAGLATSPAWTAESDQASALFGSTVSTAGDVNGDGYSDVIIGALYYDNGQQGEGRAFVYHGSAGGLATSAAWTAESNQASASFGSTVSTAGDVNGDGYSDVIIGASTYDNEQGHTGKAFVYHGSPAGLQTSPAWTAQGDQNVNLFGLSVSSAGDVNGDGFLRRRRRRAFWVRREGLRLLRLRHRVESQSRLDRGSRSTAGAFRNVRRHSGRRERRRLQ